MKANITKYPKLTEVSQRLDVNPFWLWLAIQLESGWNPKAVNVTSGATGLIQFMPNTAISLGKSPASILGSDVNSQLELVYAYMLPYKKRLKNMYDVYFAIFYPYAIGKGNNYILGSEKSMAYAKLVAKQNPAINVNKDDVITVGEFKKNLKQKAELYGYNPVQDLFYKLSHLF